MAEAVREVGASVYGYAFGIPHQHSAPPEEEHCSAIWLVLISIQTSWLEDGYQKELQGEAHGLGFEEEAMNKLLTDMVPQEPGHAPCARCTVHIAPHLFTPKGCHEINYKTMSSPSFLGYTLYNTRAASNSSSSSHRWQSITSLVRGSRPSLSYQGLPPRVHLSSGGDVCLTGDHGASGLNLNTLSSAAPASR
ncbi:hypothetical protein E2C01_005142 [Portunus trituberculatus]|uniref:Uncharacterized protein n=1 Tax=Portunus trituberculatus TaxID=210409 RepID=A0A5B7CVU6_PORTR|nr:hypothetical protein [Portunus trituberculatus]